MDKLTKSASLCNGKSNKVFYRKIFYNCCDFIENKSGVMKNFLVLTGPRKCGKTTCLKQIRDYVNNKCNYKFNEVKLYNFKNNEVDSNVVMNEIISKTNTLFLLDEVTYIKNLSGFLVNIDMDINTGNKVILTGSQMFMLKLLSNKVLSTNAMYIHTSYLDFEEWLLKENRITSYGSECNVYRKDYIDYAFGLSEFTGIEDNLEYISSCVDETISSEYYNADRIYSLYDTDNSSQFKNKILGVLYSSIVYIHNNVSYNSYLKYKDNLEYLNYKNNNSIDESDILSRFRNKTKSLLPDAHKLSKDELKRIILFLIQSDLVVVVENVDFNSNVYKLEQWLTGNIEIDLDIIKLFSMFNICPKTPIFYINIFKELYYNIGTNKLKEMITNNILSSMYECTIRQLLANIYVSNFQYNYSMKDIEVDFISYNFDIAMEISIGKNHNTIGLDYIKKLRNDIRRILLISLNNDINCDYRVSTISENNDIECYDCYYYALLLTRNCNNYYTGIIYESYTKMLERSITIKDRD